MSRNSITLKAGDRKVRCAANKYYAVAIPDGVGKLTVTKRTDSVLVVGAHLRKIARDYPRYFAYAFDLATGRLFYTHTPGAVVPADFELANFARGLLGGRS